MRPCVEVSPCPWVDGVHEIDVRVRGRAGQRRAGAEAEFGEHAAGETPDMTRADTSGGLSMALVRRMHLDLHLMAWVPQVAQRHPECTLDFRTRCQRCGIGHVVRESAQGHRAHAGSCHGVVHHMAQEPRRGEFDGDFLEGFSFSGSPEMVVVCREASAGQCHVA